MPLAGQVIRALDFTPAAITSVGANETAFTNTAFEPGVTTTGVQFTAPTSGRVRVSWHARYESNTIGSVRVLISAEVREGATIGTGVVVSGGDANDGFSLETPQDDPAGGNTRQQSSMFRDITGLIPGNSYNARVMHRLSAAGSGDIFDRSITVTPLF